MADAAELAVMPRGQAPVLRQAHQLGLQHPQAMFFAYLVAVAETLIAVALITGFARKLTYSAAILFNVLIWATAEGFGGPYTSGASDIGTAVIYAVVFAALLCFAYYQGPSRLSTDYYLEQKISWWHWAAEAGHHGDYRAPRTTALQAAPPAAPRQRHARA